MDCWLAGQQPPTETATFDSDSVSRPRSQRPLLLGLLGALAVAVVFGLVHDSRRSDVPVTRGEFVIRLVEALEAYGSGPHGEPVEWPVNCSITLFEDIDEAHPLARDCRIAYALSQRIVEGNREGETLDPDLPIKRIEAARLLMLGVPRLRQYYDQQYRRYEDRCRRERVCVSIEIIKGREEFLDVPTFDSYPTGGWYYYHVYAVTELGIMRPKTSFRFDTTGTVVREEMDHWLCVALQKC